MNGKLADLKMTQENTDLKKLIAILLLLFVTATQAIPLTAADRKCVDMAHFARSVRIAMIGKQQEADVEARVDIVRKNLRMPDEEWAIAKAWIHTVFTKPELASSTPDDIYDYAISTCGGQSL